jgi:DsbC/DsbD-like thiol-disulfide interchange protein
MMIADVKEFSATFLLVVGLLGWAAGWAAGGEKHVSATLLADVSSIQPGRPFRVGVLFRIDPGWHIYWKNPGDSGMATRVSLELPPGLSAGAVEFPAPQFVRLPGDILNYVYEDQVMLTVPVTESPEFARQRAGEVTINAKVRWLVCQDVCIPGGATLELKMPAAREGAEDMAGTAGAAGNRSLFEQWAARMPRAPDPANVAGVVRSVVQVVVHRDVAIDLHPSGKNVAGGAAGSMAGSMAGGLSAGITARVTVTISWVKVPNSIQWFPGPAEGFDITDASASTVGGKTVAGFALASPSGASLPGSIDCVLTYVTADGQRMALDVPIGSSDQRESSVAQ